MREVLSLEMTGEKELPCNDDKWQGPTRVSAQPCYFY